MKEGREEENKKRRKNGRTEGRTGMKEGRTGRKEGSKQGKGRKRDRPIYNLEERIRKNRRQEGRRERRHLTIARGT